MNNPNQYTRAIIDFQQARRKADIQNLLSLLTGRSNELLSYEEVRQKLRAIEGNRQELQEIPINSIVGSVGRYTDFNKDFLPRREVDRDRWSRVMAKATGSLGLPPIEVYQIGEAYFVLDGNHRTSVAKELGATHIQAYVTEVKTKIPITPDLNPDELIIKAEYINFLEKTNLNILRPESDLTVSAPGRYPILLEHIAVHQYFMGINEQREIPYNEAVSHWYDEVYLPVAEIITERGVLRYFPDRTEADMYLWLAKHQEELQNELGWQIDTEKVAEDIISQYSFDLSQMISRGTNRILDAVTPDSLETGPPTGQWRKHRLAQRDSTNLFQDILVTISKDDHEWLALKQAIQIAKREGAVLHGLHVVSNPDQINNTDTDEVVETFKQHCKAAEIPSEIAIETGSAARKICERAQWADLIIGKLTYPPADQLLARLSSGFRTMVRRCSLPILALPGSATPIQKALLAYNGSPKSEEALYIAAYMSSQWQIPLVVLTVKNRDVEAEVVQNKARAYLSKMKIHVSYCIDDKEVVESILHTAQDHDCNLVLIGGYKASPMVEVVLGSVVDDILRKTTIPILICR